uniref:LPXTG cell wall anchor domain-containing protein n=1 Tax=uncultured Limosilactobacillus sp. TaxID=2837629 RepID=UPI0025EA0A47
ADGTVVKTQTVNGYVGDSTTLNFTAPDGYQLANGQVTSQSFTFNKTNNPVIVKVVEIPVSANVEVKYETADGTVVKTQTVNGYVGDSTTLNFTAPDGYQLANGQATSQTFTFNKSNDPVVVQITAIPVSASVEVKYETADGHVVKTQTVNGYVGDSTTLNFTAPTGYELAAGQVASQAFTFNKNNDPVVVQVTAVPVSASVEVKYETADGAVVKSETVNGYVGDSTTLSFTAPTGYQLSQGQADSQSFTFNRTNEPVIVKVVAVPVSASAEVKYETADGTVVKTQTVNGYVGDSTTLNFTAPAGYQLANGQAASQAFTFNKNNDPVVVKVTAVPFSASVEVKYETADGTLVKTQTVNGYVGDSTTLNFTAPAGYQLAGGQAANQAFTFNKTNEPVVVHVAAVPVSASVEVKYETADGTVVKTDTVNGYVGDQVHLNFVAPAGCEIVDQLPADTYTFTGNDQPIVITVRLVQEQPDHGDHGQSEIPTTPTDHGQQDQPEQSTPTEPTRQAGTNEIKEVAASQPTTKTTNNKQADKLPQTGTRRQLSLMALGGLAIMATLGLGLSGKTRRHE